MPIRGVDPGLSRYSASAQNRARRSLRAAFNVSGGRNEPAGAVTMVHPGGVTMIHRLITPCILSLALAAPAVAGEKLAVGLPFPDLTLPALEDGKPVSIRDFRGQKLILHIFASW